MFRELKNSFNNDEWVKGIYTVDHERTGLRLWVSNGAWSFTGPLNSIGRHLYIPVYMRHILYFYYWRMVQRAEKATRIDRLPDNFIKKDKQNVK